MAQVCARSFGHAFFLEDGAEVNNTFARNLGVQAYAVAWPRRLLPSDATPSMFWITHPWNTFEGNAAAGAVSLASMHRPARAHAPSPLLALARMHTCALDGLTYADEYIRLSIEYIRLLCLLHIPPLACSTLASGTRCHTSR